MPGVAFSFEIDASDEARVRRLLTDRRTRVGKIVGTAADPYTRFTTEVGIELARRMRAEAPRDLGRLAESIEFRLDGRLGGTVIARAPYSHFVRVGTRPHFPPVRALRGWSARHGISPWAVRAKIGREGTDPNDFAERGYERTRTWLAGRQRALLQGTGRVWAGR